MNSPKTETQGTMMNQHAYNPRHPAPTQARGLLQAMALGVAVSLASLCGEPLHAAPAQSATANSPSASSLQSVAVTLLPSGARLETGGAAVVAGTSSSPSPRAVVVFADGKVQVLGEGLVVARSGHSATVLPDGRVLILGGKGADGAPVAQAEVMDSVATLSFASAPATASATPSISPFKRLPATGLISRIGHSATVLTDGRVLIAGGVDAKGNPVPQAELWNPRSGQTEPLSARLINPSRQQQAALLPSGDVLLWDGGATQANVPTPTLLPVAAERFDTPAQRFVSVSATEAQALLQALSHPQAPALQTSIPAAEARDVSGDQPLVVRFNKLLSPASLNAQSITLIGPHGPQAVQVVALQQGLLLYIWPQQELQPASRYTLFINGARDGSGQRLPLTALGFDTRALSVSAAPGVGANTTSSAPSTATPTAGPNTTRTSAAPQTPSDWFGSTLARQINQLPAAERKALGDTLANNNDDEDWLPNEGHFQGRWTSGRGRSAMQKLPPLQAAIGVTALAGQVLSLHGRPMANVTLSIGARQVRTDLTGRFLLQDLNPGFAKFEIDGSSASRDSAGRSGATTGAQYGYYAARVELQAGRTNVLPYTIWMPRLDPAGTVRIDSPLATDRIITSPRIPGLELRIPAGTVIRDRQGKVVTEINVTAIPVDRPPFPVPDLGVPVYFTIQPGGAVLQSTSGRAPQGAQLYYPNFRGEVPGARGVFWNYDPLEREWFVYGLGRISADAKQAIPDPGVTIHEFTGAMFNGSDAPPPAGPPPCECPGAGGSGPGGGSSGQPWGQASSAGSGNSAAAGDPVDLVTGQFAHVETDLHLPDVMPITLSRTYRALDKNSRAFGVGMTHPYDIFLYSANSFQEIDLILPNGGRVRYVRTSPGTSYTDANFKTDAPGEWNQSVIERDNARSGWQLKFRDGRRWFFYQYQPLSEMADKSGNITRIERENVNGTSGKIVRILSPNGRALNFSYAGERISGVTDSIGRQFTYSYDPAGRMLEAIDPLGGKRIYTWDTVNNRITSVKDPNGNVMVTNQYDANGRVSKQTLADTSTFLFAYTADANNKVTQADVTDRRGNVRRVAINPQGMITSTTYPLGKPEQQVSSYVYGPTGLLTQKTDPLGRKTAYEHDTRGNTTKVTRLATTAEAYSTTITYDPLFNQPLTVKNPLGHQTTFTYNAKGQLTKVSNPLGHNLQISNYDAQGKPKTVTYPLGKVTQMTYEGADLASVTDPLSRTLTTTTDGAGRVVSTTNPLGHRTLNDWDALDRLIQSTNAQGNSVKFTFDANGFLKTQVDEKNNPAATHSYNAMGQRTSRKDALNQTSTATYTPAGQLQQIIDRKGQLTRWTYDNLGRTTRVGYGATAAAPTAFKSVIDTTWDGGNRVTQVQDKTCTNPATSLNCATVASVQATTYTYDSRDRLTKKVTPQGEVNYTYDTLDRRTSVIVKNGAPGSQTTQPTINYTWDNADRLTQISQAAGAINAGVAQTITLTYDAASRRTQTKLANGSTITYTYDAAGQLTAMAYKKADGSVIGDLTYTYDQAGRRTSMGGSLAKIDLPTTNITAATYDANNRLTQWIGKTFSYDPTGNLIADGTSTYQWDERGQLKGVSTGVTGLGSFQYNAAGQRTGKTIGVGATSATTGFLYDGANFIQELNGTSNTSPIKAHLLTGGIDETFLRIEGANLQSFLPDGNNNTVRLLDKNQAKVVDYSYEAYGKTKQDTANSNSQQYTGRENDNPGNDHGLYFYRARYYMPGAARFISEDPIGWDSGQTNGYSYVGGDPISFNDPSGHWANFAIGAGLRIVGGRAASAAIGKFAREALGATAGIGAACVLAGVCTFNEAEDCPPGADKPVPENVGPGTNAGDSVPAGPSARPTKEQQGQINDIGNVDGCHTCGTTDPGTKSGNWVGDHQPPTALNPQGKPQSYYPQCLGCSRVQGGRIRGLLD